MASAGTLYPQPLPAAAGGVPPLVPSTVCSDPRDALAGPLPLATKTPAQKAGTGSCGAGWSPPLGCWPGVTAGMCWPGGTQGSQI